MKSERELWLEKRVEELEREAKLQQQAGLVHMKRAEASEAEVARLTREKDAMVEEAADEQTRSIKAALMDEMHDHALTWDDFGDEQVRLLSKVDAAEAEVARLKVQRDAALVHGPEDLIRALEESRAEVERVRALQMAQAADGPAGGRGASLRSLWGRGVLAL